MKVSRSKAVLILIFLAGLVLPGALTAQPSPLADRVEAVVIKGELLPPEMLGAPLESYRVFAASGSGLSVIPMQIDERDEKGNILVKEGPRAGRADGRFHKRDELAILARDSGRPYQGDGPEGCAKTVTVTLTDKETGAAGHVILARCEDPPLLSPISYVRYEDKSRMVFTDRYRFAWKMAQVYYYDYITINNGPDILDRLKIRATFGKWDLTYTLNEEFFKMNQIGFNNGPVRVIYWGESYFGLGPFGSVPVPSHLTFGPEYVILENPMDARFNPALLGLDFNVIIGHDAALDKTRGYKICANVVPDCLPLINELSEQEIKALIEKEIYWGGISGPEGALITHFVPDPDLEARFLGSYRYDEKATDPPEYVPGLSPRLGFNIVDWKNVKREVYDLNFYHFFIDQYSKEEFERFDRMITNPLVVTVK